MPFEELQTITRANAPPTAVISYMPGGHKDATKRKGERKPILRITVPTTICGTSKSERFVLLLGSGDDVGKLRIRGVSAKKAAADDGVVPAQMKHAFRFNFGFVPRLGEEYFDGERRPVRKIGDEEFEIDVPASWFEGDAA